MSTAPARARKAASRDAAGASRSTDGGSRGAATGSHRSLGRSAAVTMPLQRRSIDGGPGDPYEREAATVARRITAGQDGGPIGSLDGHGPAQRVAVGDDEVQRVAVGEDEVQRVAVGDEDVQRVADAPAGGAGAGVAASLHRPGGGRPVPASVRATIEPRLGASLDGVQVHTGPAAADAAASVGARAFTAGPHIVLGDGESPFDLGLMAHEAAHTVQQGVTSTPHDRFAPRETRLQRLPGTIRSGLGRFARHIPGYTLFSVIIGTDPITGDRVERSARNLVGGLLGLLPFGTVIFDKLVELDVIDDALGYVEAQLSRFGLTLGRIERMLTDAWDEMDFLRLDPFAHNLGILVRRFGALLSDVTAFAGAMVDAVMELIRDAVVGVADGLLADEPAWSLIRKVLGHDPLRDEPVEATTAEMLEDFLVLIGREQELEQMRERGTLQEAADWLDQQLGAFLGLLGELGALFASAWEAIQPSNLANLPTNLRDLASRTVGLLGRAWDLAWEVAAKALELVKQALLNWLSEFAHEAPGFHLLTVILERNPFTDEVVPRTAENLIRGFITLLPGGDAAYAELSESGVIGQAAATIDGAMSELGISWEMVTDLFLAIWDGLSIDDLIDPLGAFARIRDQFGGPIERIIAFIRVVLTEVISLILQLMNFPSDVLGSIIANAGAAYEDIKNDPVQFLLNLLITVKEGFSRFLSGIFGHLLSGLTDWLFRGLKAAGIEPPSELTLESGLDLVMQVLGLTVDRMWEKLAERIGQDRVDQIRAGMDRLEGIWTFVRDVQERGPAAIWEHIQSQISGLWDSLLQQARDWVMVTIVQRVTAKLLSMLDPSGVMAVVNSFIAFFKAIQSVIEYVRDLLDIVDRWVGTLASVARGDVEPGAARLELGLISAVPVAIGFLANQVGLGNVGDRLTEIIGGLRAMVDQALDWLLDQAERLLQQVMTALGFGPEAEEVGDSGDPEHDAAVTEGLGALATEEARFAQGGRITFEDAEKVAAAVRAAFPVFSSLTVVDGGTSWKYRWTASDGTDHDPPETVKAEDLGVIGLSADAEGIADKLDAAGYTAPYLLGATRVIRRKPGNTHLPKLSIDASDTIREGPARDQLSAIDQPDWVPESADVDHGVAHTISWGTGSDPAGEKMRAPLLTSKGPGGSTVSNDSTLWAVLSRRAEVTRSFWVQGHLLNANLHGPGNEPKNLTPLTQGDNQKHESEAERAVKKAVLRTGVDHEGETPPVVRYEVDVTYGSRSAAPTNGYDPLVLETLAAEAKLATQLVCRAWYLEDDGSGTWSVRGDQFVDARITLASAPAEFVRRRGKG